jgi:hypothetical protein
MKVSTTDNSGLAKGGPTCFEETSVLIQKVLLRINSGAKKPTLRQSTQRYRQVYGRPTQQKIYYIKTEK